MVTEKTTRKGAPKGASVVWKFGDEQYRMPLAEHEKTLLRQWHRMAESADAGLRAAGDRLLDEHARKSARATIDALKKEAQRPKQSAGGKAGAAARNTSWHNDLEKAAKQWLTVNSNPRGVASAMKKRQAFADRDIASIRRVLKERGVK